MRATTASSLCSNEAKTGIERPLDSNKARMASETSAIYGVTKPMFLTPRWAQAAIVAVMGGAIGIAAAVMIYLKGRFPASKVELPIMAEGWRFDESIANFMGGPGRKGFDLVAWFDATFVDGAVNGVGRVVREGGGQLRRLQSGLVRSYAAMVAIGAIGLIIWFLSRASF